MIWKVWMFSFILHQKPCQNVWNSQKYISLKIYQKSENRLFLQKFFKKIDFFNILSHFKKFDFHEFLTFLHEFWCKMKLIIHTLQIKSFLPPSQAFYTLFVGLHATQRRSIFGDSSQWWSFELKKGGKKLVRGVKTFDLETI